MTGRPRRFTLFPYTTLFRSVSETVFKLDCTDHRFRLDTDELLVSRLDDPLQDRKSTRLNSSHVEISYAVFCLKKKPMTPGVAPYQPIALAPSTGAPTG